MSESEAPRTDGGRPEPPAERPGLLANPAVRVAVVGLLVALPLLWASLAPRVEFEPPGVIGPVGGFELTDQRGRTVTAKDLRGRPWVASVVFTRCPTVCPTLMDELRLVERDTRLSAAEARFVTFTADPEHDTPEVLAAWAKERGTEGERWTFLTGPPEEVREAVVKGLKLGLGEDGEAPFGIFHATHVALIDRDGRLRGYHRSGDPEAMDALVRDLVLLSGFTR